MPETVKVEHKDHKDRKTGLTPANSKENIINVTSDTDDDEVLQLAPSQIPAGLMKRTNKDEPVVLMDDEDEAMSLERNPVLDPSRTSRPSWSQPGSSSSRPGLTYSRKGVSMENSDEDRQKKALLALRGLQGKKSPLGLVRLLMNFRCGIGSFQHTVTIEGTEAESVRL